MKNSDQDLTVTLSRDNWFTILKFLHRNIGQMVDIEPVVTLFSEINKLDPEMISELKKIQDKRNKEG